MRVYEKGSQIFSQSRVLWSVVKFLLEGNNSLYTKVKYLKYKGYNYYPISNHEWMPDFNEELKNKVDYYDHQVDEEW